MRTACRRPQGELSFCFTATNHYTARLYVFAIFFAIALRARTWPTPCAANCGVHAVNTPRVISSDLHCGITAEFLIALYDEPARMVLEVGYKMVSLASWKDKATSIALGPASLLPLPPDIADAT